MAYSGTGKTAMPTSSESSKRLATCRASEGLCHVQTLGRFADIHCFRYHKKLAELTQGEHIAIP